MVDANFLGGHLGVNLIQGCDKIKIVNNILQSGNY